MRKFLPILFLASFMFACKKDDSNTSESKYLVKVECTDCKVSVADYGDPLSAEIKGAGFIPMSYVPSTIQLSIWSNVANDNAYVTFTGGSVKYAGISLFSGVLKVKPDYDLIEVQLPKER